jgi:hypothetical protein
MEPAESADIGPISGRKSGRGALHSRGEMGPMEKGAAGAVPPAEREGGEGAGTVRCAVCGAEFGSEEAASAHSLRSHKDPQAWRTGRPAGDEEAGRPRPPREEAEEEAIRYLERELPSVYGMSGRQAEQCIRDLRQVPHIVWNPQALYFHIRQYAGPKLNEYALGMRLARVCEILGIGGGPSQSPPPPVPPPTPGQPATPPPWAWWPQQAPQAYPWSWWPQQPQAPPAPPAPPRAGEEAKPRKTYKVVVEGQEVVCEDEASYRAWLEFLERRERREEARRGEPEVEIPLEEGKTAKVPASHAPYLLQAQWAQERRREAEERARRLEEQYGKLEEQYAKLADMLREETSPEAVARRAEAMGYARSGSPAFGLVSRWSEDLGQKADRLLGLLERQVASGAPRGPLYTPAERGRREEEVIRRIEGAERLAGHEDRLIRTAKRLADEDRAARAGAGRP